MLPASWFGIALPRSLGTCFLLQKKSLPVQKVTSDLQYFKRTRVGDLTPLRHLKPSISRPLIQPHDLSLQGGEQFWKATAQ